MPESCKTAPSNVAFINRRICSTAEAAAALGEVRMLFIGRGEGRLLSVPPPCATAKRRPGAPDALLPALFALLPFASLREWRAPSIPLPPDTNAPRIVRADT